MSDYFFYPRSRKKERHLIELGKTNFACRSNFSEIKLQDKHVEAFCYAFLDRGSIPLASTIFLSLKHVVLLNSSTNSSTKQINLY